MKNLKKVLGLALLVTASMSVSGCAPRVGGHDYAVGSIGEVSETYPGVIVAARRVNINASDNSKPGAGALAGGVAGGVLGNISGAKGRGKTLATLAGAGLGAVAGHYAEGQLKDQVGMEYQVQLDKAGLMTITQGADPLLSLGQRVLLIKSQRGRSRVIADHSR